MCEPSERVYDFGLVQISQTPESNLHSNVAVASGDEKLNVA